MSIRLDTLRTLALVAALIIAPAVLAFDGPVEKKVFSLPTYTTFGGKTIRDVRLGYETYGTLNAAGGRGRVGRLDPGDGVGRPVPGPGRTHRARDRPGFDISPYVVEMLDVWTLPIRLDPKWNNGDYYGKDEPVDGVGQALKIVTIAARAHGKTTDANSMIYMSKANQLFNLGDEVKGMKAKILFVPASSDMIFPPELSKRAAERYRAQGDAIRAFLQR